jgi:hypothetical protein
MRSDMIFIIRNQTISQLRKQNVINYLVMRRVLRKG